MARSRRAASKSSGKMFAWSNLYNGGESEEVRPGRRVISSRNVIRCGEQVSQSDLDVSDEEWEHLQKTGVVRDYPLPEGFDTTAGLSPFSFVMEQRRAEMEAAAEGEGSEKAEDLLIKASVVGTQVFGPDPEEVLMGVELPEGVEAVNEEEAKA